ncbi:MAG: DUF3854 domain-containing protein [Roseburia sp.]|nr:DUF3854 domain-containing protein [Roseburia sp.]
MEKFHIWDVISVLNLPSAPSGRSSYYIPCPCCDSKPRDKHLNINLRKEVFRCPKCGVSGGIFDLYALYTGIPREDVREEVAERLGLSEQSYRPQRRVVVKEVKESPVADIAIRHKTYTALLEKLSLASDHKDNLLGRGLREDEITQLGYKTTPVVGMTKIAKELVQEGCELSGVPGFYQTEADTWKFTVNQRGILIPVRDGKRRIQGMQIRRDDVKKRKFRWVSSTELKNGCKAEGWTHLAGSPLKTILLTEGPMKADVIHALTGLTVLAVPGVNALTQLEIALKHLKEQGLQKIMTAFDMDMATNPHVQKGYQQLLLLLDEMGFSFGTYLWDGSYKGLDDYVWEFCLKRNRS